jgi:hypothetical protein
LPAKEVDKARVGKEKKKESSSLHSEIIGKK